MKSESAVKETANTDIRSFLSVGAFVMVKIVRDSKQEDRFFSHIRGWRDGDYILMDLPEGLLLRKDNPCVVQFLSGGVVCGFRSILADGGTVRSPQFRIFWPSALETVELRTNERTEIGAFCEVTLPCGDTLEGRIHDLSVQGCGLILDEKLPKHIKVTVSLDSGKGFVFRELCGLVRNATSKGRGFLIGCAFVQLDLHVKQKLDFFLATLSANLRMADNGLKRILVYAPDVQLLQRMVSVLANHGYEPVPASCIVDVFHYLRLQRPKAVIAGLDSSEFAGPDFSRIIRHTEGIESLPIVLVGDAASPLGLQAVKQGADNLASCPEDMVQVLEKALRGT